MWHRSIFSLRRITATSSSSLSFSTSNSATAPIHLTVNGTAVVVPAHATLLEACRMAKAFVPTLCNHPRLAAVGTCRLCLVSVDRYGDGSRLLPACVTPVTEGAVVATDSQAVQRSVRTNLQLMLSDHPNACMTCSAAGHCEFQDLLARYDVKDVFPKTHRASQAQQDMDGDKPTMQTAPHSHLPHFPHTLHEWDNGTAVSAIVRDLDKCLKCGRCVRACSQLQGMDILALARAAENGGRPQSVWGADLSATECISCGQCVSFCPVGALSELDETAEVTASLLDSNVINIAQTAPAPRVALGEEFGMAPGSLSEGHLVAGLRALGFDYVFDTNVAADLTIVEEATELIARVKAGGPFPMFTSCCPGWVTMVEKSFPAILPNLSSCKSPQQMLGATIKHYTAQKLGLPPHTTIRLTSIMPCTAKKEEAFRNASMFDSESGQPHVDYVLTARELGRMLRQRHLHPFNMEESSYDDPLGQSTGAAILFGVTGGVMEAAIRTAKAWLDPSSSSSSSSTDSPVDADAKDTTTLPWEAIRGLNGVKLATVNLTPSLTLRVAVCSGAGNLRHLLSAIERKEVTVDFVEMMACPGGCIGGGGMPKSSSPTILSDRMQSIYSLDEKRVKRQSHQSPVVRKLYADWLGEPGSPVAHAHLHTTYRQRAGLTSPTRPLCQQRLLPEKGDRNNGDAADDK
jgi:iron-only hydrogenase group A